MDGPPGEQLHGIRGRIDVALDLIGRCVIAHRSDGDEGSERILDSLVLAGRELAAAAEAVDDALARKRASVGAA